MATKPLKFVAGAPREFEPPDFIAVEDGGTGLEVTSKGGIMVGEDADSMAVLSVGANGSVLTADSAQVLGVKWAAVAPATGSDLYNYSIFAAA
jgi:hypothetical protein